ncbi:MAG: 50S ribosomal protein L25 [Candidatus Zixiibacteriota bacterium]
MKEVSLPAMPRDAIGKGAARRTRSAGRIPAVMYGPEIDPVPIAIEEKAFRAANKQAGGSAIYNLEVNGKVNKTILREIQRDPLTSRITHLDFHAISMKKPIHLSIPIHFVGTSRGVKTDGGIMQTTMRELDISCLPTDIPEYIEVDVTELGIGDSVHVRDLSVPKAHILDEPRRTVVVISAPTVMKVEVAAAAEEEVAAEEAAEAAEAEAAEEKPEAEEKKEKKAEEKKEKREKREEK